MGLQQVAADDGYTLTSVAFDRSGRHLCAWAFGQGRLDRLYSWKIQEPVGHILVESTRSCNDFSSVSTLIDHVDYKVKLTE